MSDNKEKLIAYLKYLNLPINASFSADRFRLQKISFLLKSMGIGLDYDFKFWVYGVYSDELYKENFANIRDFFDLKSSYEINEKEKEILDRVKEHLPIDNNLLEATTTIIYENLVYSDIYEVVEKVKKRKPHLSEDSIISGLNFAKQMLFKREYLTNEIKQEIEVWDSID
ncbi:MAG: hypothetical protein ACP5U0_10290 [Caldisphaera sp.]